MIPLKTEFKPEANVVGPTQYTVAAVSPPESTTLAPAPIAIAPLFSGRKQRLERTKCCKQRERTHLDWKTITVPQGAERFKVFPADKTKDPVHL